MRLACVRRTYLGVSYQYQNFALVPAELAKHNTQTQTVFLFLTMYLRPKFSISVSAGPQHYSSTQAFSSSAVILAALTMVSANWQGERTTLSASYRAHGHRQAAG